ncbi:Ficolin-2,Fibrinogen-like protein A [Mytilus edulis]|uniref:Ficolin-2,Fibrinogen-like protein A n=1 Tax=Mytilus edulis TaxID=6550 RepID=A0A8S3UL29_MYTED|nr:Ficolin-2,Fibrinogen-like protein A [Mytilus edulis]
MVSKQNILASVINSLTTIDNRLKKEIEQMKEKQKLTESKLSSFETEVTNYSDIAKGIQMKDCNDANRTIHKSGVYHIYPSGAPGYKVYCDMDTDDGGWTVFQYRSGGLVSFHTKLWKDYKNGFGEVRNDRVHQLTGLGNNVLRIYFEDWEGNSRYAVFNTFSVGDEVSNYMLSYGSYSGNAGNSLANNVKFTTADRQNDSRRKGSNCALNIVYGGPWWYPNSCGSSDLNGEYVNGALDGFLEFLKAAGHNIYLTGHNIKTFDCHILINTLKSVGKTEELKKCVEGFVDTRLLFKINNPDLKSFSQVNLIKTLMNCSYDAHDALEDVIYLQKLLDFTNIRIADPKFSTATFTVQTAYFSHDQIILTKLNLPSLREFIDQKVISIGIAHKIASSNLNKSSLLLAFSRGQEEGIRQLFSEECCNQGPRVTKSSKIIRAVSNFIKQHLTERNDRVHQLTGLGNNVLRIYLEDWEGNSRYAVFNKNFLADRQNDGDGKGNNCAKNHYGGPWWYSYSCGYSDLNGEYVKGGKGVSGGKGVIWSGWKTFSYSMKVTKMMIRKK